MAFNLEAPLDKIKAHAAASTGVEAAIVGSPASLGYQVTASVTLAGFSARPDDFDAEGQHQDYLVEFGYDTGGDVDAAERAICKAVPSLKDRIDHDVTLGNTVVRASVDGRLAGTPEYVAVAGSEIRRYPVLVQCVLEEPNPEA
jgi:hypothetical protein